MDKDKSAVNTDQSAATDKTEVVTVTADDIESRLAELEADKAKAIEEATNWKIAALKAKAKNKENKDSEDESEDEKIERIVNEKIMATKIANIDSEKENLLKKALKENKELKLAQLNKTTTPPASMGSHNESTPVRDTVITPEQMAALKSRGFSDKDIERYKKNLNRYSGRQSQLSEAILFT